MPQISHLFLVTSDISLIPSVLHPTDPNLFTFGSQWKIFPAETETVPESVIVTETVTETETETEPITGTDATSDPVSESTQIIPQNQNIPIIRDLGMVIHLFDSMDNALASLFKVKKSNSPLEPMDNLESDDIIPIPGTSTESPIYMPVKKLGIKFLGIHVFGSVTWEKPYSLGQPLLIKGRTDDATVVISMNNLAKGKPMLSVHPISAQDFARLDLSFADISFRIGIKSSDTNTKKLNQKSSKSRKFVFSLSHINFNALNSNFTVQKSPLKLGIFKTKDSDMILESCTFSDDSFSSLSTVVAGQSNSNESIVNTNFIKFSGSTFESRNSTFHGAQVAVAMINYTHFHSEFTDFTNCGVGILFKITKTFVHNISTQKYNNEYRNTARIYSSPDHILSFCKFSKCELAIHVVSTQIPLSCHSLTFTHCKLCLRLDSSIIHSITNSRFISNSLGISLYSTLHTLDLEGSTTNQNLQSLQHPIKKDIYFTHVSSLDFISQNLFSNNQISIEITGHCSIWRCYSNRFVIDDPSTSESPKQAILMYDKGASGHFDNNDFCGTQFNPAVSISSTCGKSLHVDSITDFEPHITTPISFRFNSFKDVTSGISIHNSILSPIYIFRNDFVNALTGVLLTLCLNPCIIAENTFKDNLEFAINIFHGNPIVQKNNISYSSNKLPISAIRVAEGQSFIYKNTISFAGGTSVEDFSCSEADIFAKLKLFLVGHPSVSLWDTISIPNLGIPKPALAPLSAGIFVTGNNSVVVANNNITPPISTTDNTIFISICIPRSGYGRLFLLQGNDDETATTSPDNSIELMESRALLTLLFGESTIPLPETLGFPSSSIKSHILPLWLGNLVSSEFQILVGHGILRDSAIMTTIQQVARYMANIDVNPKGVLLPKTDESNSLPILSLPKDSPIFTQMTDTIKAQINNSSAVQIMSEE